MIKIKIKIRSKMSRLISKSFIASEKQTNEPVANNRKTMVRRTTVDSYLRKFLLAVRRKKDGDEFVPTTIVNLLFQDIISPGQETLSSRLNRKNLNAKEIKHKKHHRL
jgi:hypothetical protein